MSQASIPPKRRKAQLMRTLQGGAYQKKKKEKEKPANTLLQRRLPELGKQKESSSVVLSFQKQPHACFRVNPTRIACILEICRWFSRC